MKKETFKSKTDNGCIAHTVIEVVTLDKNKRVVVVTQEILAPVNDALNVDNNNYFPFSRIVSRVISGKVIVMNRMAFWDSSFRKVIKSYKELIK